MHVSRRLFARGATRHLAVGIVGLLVGTSMFVSGGAPRAAAGYEALADGGAVAQAQHLPAPAAPVAVAVGPNVTVTWSAVTSSGGQPVDGYVVERLDEGGVPVVVLAGCDTVSVGTSCNESGVPAGTWTYRVQAVLGSWMGATSDAGAAITVLGAVLTISSPAPSSPITSLPATVTGTIDQFVVGETLTFRLDSPTGPTVVGTPSTVTTVTAQAVSVSLPAGTPDGPRSVVVVGSMGSVASAAVSIVIPPVLVSLTMHDVDVDGRVDEVRATFDDVLAPYTAGTAPWTLANVPSGGSLAGVSVVGNLATLAITEGAGPPSTAVGGFTLALSGNAAGIRDEHGHTASFTARAPIDAAAPAPVTMVLQDTTGNGRVDRVAITWSEVLAATTTTTTPWTLAGVPSGGVLGAVSASGIAARLTIAEGTGALDTAVGAMTVSLTPSASGPRDAAGNRSSFAARTPADGARPLLVSFSDTNGSTDGRIQPGDTLVSLFSEPVDPATIGVTVTITVRDPSGGGADRLSIPGLTNGERSLGANGYVVTDNTSFNFTGSAVTYASGGRAVVVSVGPTCSGICSAIGTQPSNASFSFAPAATIRDLAGNAVRTTTRSSSLRLF